ncbi:hypothetical protein G5714_024605 [Onychostoma macrolepis]|uniref:Uncharacterized protein n=1 Tax=Onychostoma macrolepis TaxID=369639 RepID=A0A7J6BI24_9TELE|nr:hypothetical protein G5714_024605 [Onychostoma macrolepis]
MTPSRSHSSGPVIRASKLENLTRITRPSRGKTPPNSGNIRPPGPLSNAAFSRSHSLGAEPRLRPEGEPQDTHSTRLREPGPRAEGGDSLTPTLPASGNQDLGQRGRLFTPTLPASGNQDLGQRGHSPAPLTRLREPGPRAEGATSCTLYPPGNQDWQRGAPWRTLLLASNSPPRRRLRGPPDLQEGPLPRPPLNPGIPHLSPVTDSAIRARRTRPLGTPGDFTTGHPKIDLGFGRLLDFQGSRDSAEPDPRNHDSARGGTATPLRRLREPDAAEGPPHAPLRHWFPQHRLRFFFRRHPPATGTPDTAGGRTEAARWASSADKRLDRGKTFNGSQSALKRGAALLAASPSSHEWLSAPPAPEGRPPSQANQSPRAMCIVTPRRDSDLEALSHNPTDGSRTSGSSAKHTH